MGIQREEVIGKRVQELIEVGVIRDKNTAPSLEVVKTKKHASALENTRDGKNVLLTSSPLLDENGEIIIIINNIRDVTDINRLREESLNYKRMTDQYEIEVQELRALNNLIDSLMTKSKAMNDVAERAMRAAAVDATVLVTGESGVGKNVGYVSLCPELDVASQGDTIEEARDNLQEALELFFKCVSPEELKERLHGDAYGVLRSEFET